jgi:Tol biopolymer transport system component
MSGISASTSGLIAYRSGSANELIWTDRAGNPTGSPIAHSDPPNCPELSPDGRWIAFDRTVNGNRDVWLLELARNVTRRFTFDSGIDATPIWSPDGNRIAFRSNRTGVNQIYLKATTGGTGSEERLPLSDLSVGVSDWSTDGQTLLFVVVDPKTTIDLWAIRLDGDRKPFVVANTPFEERDAQFSPDGKWIAYASNESGRMEIYIQGFPQPGQKFQVSTTGGTQPRWRHDGRELFFVGAGGAMMASSVNAKGGTTIDTGAPAVLFPARLFPAQGGLLRHQYAVNADGSRFLLNAVAESTANAPITVIANWRGFETIGTR